MALTIVVLCSACASGGKPREPEASVHAKYTTCDVIRAFREVTGEELRYKRRLDLTRLGGGVTDEVSVSRTEKSSFGEFRFLVDVKPPTAPGFEDSTASGSPDARGIYWTHQVPERAGERPYWAASKVRRNVTLTWFNAAKRTNANWDTLDRVLETMRHGKSSCT